jgi:hypothetical protein
LLDALREEKGDPPAGWMQSLLEQA